MSESVGGATSGQVTPPACNEARVLLMGFIDGELDAGASRKLEDHLAVCVDCRREEQAYRRLGEVTGAMIEHGVPIDTARAWERIYDRIARSLGWALLWLGVTLLAGFGLWHVMTGILLDSSVPVVVRLGVGSLVMGLLLLLVNIARERAYLYRTERYKEVVR